MSVFLKDICGVLFFLVIAFSAFGIGIESCSWNELGCSLSSSVFWKSLFRIRMFSSLRVW